MDTCQKCHFLHQTILMPPFVHSASQACENLPRAAKKPLEHILNNAFPTTCQPSFLVHAEKPVPQAGQA